MARPRPILDSDHKSMLPVAIMVVNNQCSLHVNIWLKNISPGGRILCVHIKYYIQVLKLEPKLVESSPRVSK